MSSPTILGEQSELFAPVQREATLTTRVARQMEEMIVESRLRTGDKLPPERELSRQLGVSRTVIREAVSALVAKNLLEASPSGGIVVRTPGSETVAESLSFYLRTRHPQLSYDKVSEVRRVLEVNIAALAAENRTEEDLQLMRHHLEETEQALDDRERYARADVAFHATLASATGNELFRLLLDSVASIMYQVRYVGFDAPDAQARTARYHRAILDQVEKQDAAGARQAMLDHLLEAENTQREVGGNKTFTPV